MALKKILPYGSGYKGFMYSMSRAYLTRINSIQLIILIIILSIVCPPVTSAERGTEPEKAYKGTFNIRISPELHKNAAIYAAEHKISLNSVVETALAGFMVKA